MNDDDTFAGGFFLGLVVAVVITMIIVGAYGVLSKRDCWEASQDPKYAGYAMQVTGGIFPKCRMEVAPNVWVNPYSVSVEDE